MNNKGFVATALLYTFFLAFTALIVTLIGTFTSNKRILDRFNSEVKNSLSIKKYDFSVYVENGTISGGRTLRNIYNNGDLNLENGKHYYMSSKCTKAIGDGVITDIPESKNSIIWEQTSNISVNISDINPDCETILVDLDYDFGYIPDKAWLDQILYFKSEIGYLKVSNIKSGTSHKIRTYTNIESYNNYTLLTSHEGLIDGESKNIENGKTYADITLNIESDSTLFIKWGN